MTSDLISRATDGYPCHVCLMSSSNPSICTHCGAKIELTDVNEAIFKPPGYGTYFVPSNSFSKELVLDAIILAKINFYQNYDVADKSDGISISSNNIAYKIFSTIICKKTSKTIADVMSIITFITEIGGSAKSDI